LEKKISCDFEKKVVIWCNNSSCMKHRIQPLSKEEIPNLHITYSFADIPFARLCLASTEKGFCSVSLVMGTDLEAIEALQNKFRGATFEVSMNLHDTKQRGILDTGTEKVNALNPPLASGNAGSDFKLEHAAFLKLFEKEPVSLNFHLLGTPFQLDVWNALLEIPFGGTSTYGVLAAEIGRPKAFRAVGSAVGDNPIFYAVPCHRVLPASGGIGNYYWGPEIKKSLLDWEKAF